MVPNTVGAFHLDICLIHTDIDPSLTEPQLNLNVYFTKLVF